MDEVKRKPGRPRKEQSVPRMERIKMNMLTFTRNVRHAHMWNSEGYDPTDIGNYAKEDISAIKNSMQDRVERGLPIFVQMPTVYIDEQGKYEVQVGNTRSITAYTFFPEHEDYVLVVPERMEDVDKLTENIHFQPSEISIAITIRNARDNGQSVSKACHAAGWSKAQASYWLDILDSLPINMVNALCSNLISKEVARLISGNDKVQQLVDECIAYGDAINTERDLWSLFNNRCYNIALTADECAIEQSWGDDGATIYDCEWAFKYSYGMYRYILYLKEDASKYSEWYEKRKVWIMGQAGVKSAEDAQYGNYDSSGKPYSYVPYNGAGKAYWKHHQLMSRIEDTTAKKIEKTAILKKRTNDAHANEYAGNQIRKWISEEMKNRGGEYDLDILVAMMAQQVGLPDEKDLRLIIAKHLSYAWLSDKTVKLMPGNEEQYEMHFDAYIDKMNDAVSDSERAVRDALDASIAIYYPTVDKTDVVWHIDWSEKVHYDDVAPDAIPILSELGKKMGFKGNIKNDKDIARLSRCILQHVEKWSAREQSLYEQNKERYNVYMSGVNTMRERLMVYITCYDDVYTKAEMVQCCERFKQYLKDHHSQRARTGWTKAHVDHCDKYIGKGGNYRMLMYMVEYVLSHGGNIK